MAIKGIKKRWIYNSLGFTVSIFTVLIISFALTVRGYFYSGIQQTIKSRTNELYDIFHGYSAQTDSKFIDIAKMYVENFSDDDIMELMVFDENNNVIISSLGFLPDSPEVRPDYEQARGSDSGFGIWEGKGYSGEKLMAVTRCLYDQSNKYLGSVRCVVSMEKANFRIIFGSLILMFIGMLVVVFMFISGMYFIKSIVRPISEICLKAKLIAQGDFHIKIDKKYDDEIGELSDTVNYMAEELDESEKMKNEFISSVSHELRTPLTAIKGWAETMQICDSDPTTMKRGLDTIVKEAGRLSWIVEGLLDFSSIKEKRINLIKEKIDILAELGEAVYMFKERAENENKTLIYNEPKMLPPVLGDKNRLRQVFINIIDNALKYTSEGGGISVNVGTRDKTVYISVTDNGCGIPAEHLPNVTKKFYKANYLKRGSGIGLAIVDEIVSLHGGVLDIISEEGFGTTVTVSLPIVSDEGITQAENQE